MSELGNLSHSLEVYAAYFAQFLKARLAYRVDFFAAIFANMLVTLSGLLFILFLMDGEVVVTLGGWRRDEVLFIYGYSMISLAIFSSVAPNLYRFGDRYIIQGEFDRVLLRPLNSLSQVLFESFNLESLGSLLVGLGVVFYTAKNLLLEFGVIDYLWLFFSSAAGAAILLSVFVSVASLSFHFQDRLGISAPVYNLINFGRYPLPIYNKLIQFILRWVVPFAFVAFYPATHFFKKEEFYFYCYLTPLVALVCVMIAAFLWRFGVSRYSSTGN